MTLCSQFLTHPHSGQSVICSNEWSFDFSRISYKCDHVYSLFCLAYFNSSSSVMILGIYFSCTYQFLQFYCWVVFHCMGIIQFLYPFTTYWQIFGLFSDLGCEEQCCCEHLYADLYADICFHFSWMVTEEWDYWVICKVYTSKKIAQLFWSSCIMSSVWRLWLFHVFPNTWYPLVYFFY